MLIVMIFSEGYCRYLALCLRSSVSLSVSPCDFFSHKSATRSGREENFCMKVVCNAKIEYSLKKEDNLKNECKLKNVDNFKNEDNFKNKDNLKNEDDL